MLSDKCHRIVAGRPIIGRAKKSLALEIFSTVLNIRAQLRPQGESTKTRYATPKVGVRIAPGTVQSVAL